MVSFDAAKLPAMFGASCILLFNISLNRTSKTAYVFTLILHQSPLFRNNQTGHSAGVLH